MPKFNLELHAASKACDCRGRKDYRCGLCQRAWDQAWDLAEGKITMPTWSEEHLRELAIAEDEADCVNVGIPDEIMEKL